MFGKKCTKCGKKLSKHKVWHAKTGTFEYETTCIFCLSSDEKPKTTTKDLMETTIRYKTTDELEKERSEREAARIEENKIYEEFLKNEKTRIEQEKQTSKQQIRSDKQIPDDESKRVFRELGSSPPIPDKIPEPTLAGKRIYGNCAKYGCDEKLHGLNSKPCKLCEQQVCLKHLQPENHDCPKVRYVPYIRKTWLRKYGQNVSSGVYTVVCDTCGYVSDFPSSIEQAGASLESHLRANEQCLQNKRTFLEELINGPIPQEKIRSSITVDSNRKFWVCAHCRPARKFTDRDEYIAHHYTHN